VIPIRSLLLLGVIVLAIRMKLRTPAPQPARGIAVNLVHECTYPEDFNTLGDDRQIIIRLTGHGMFINETAMSREDVVATISKIMATRQEKLAWLIADDSSSYGEVVGELSEVVRGSPGLAVMLPTTIQVKASEARPIHVTPNGVLPRGIEHCPALPLVTNP
jgi:biopolymer transport protein ExbD